jgi:hypothetical protein
MFYLVAHRGINYVIAILFRLFGNQFDKTIRFLQVFSSNLLPKNKVAISFIRIFEVKFL